ncbi:MAG: IPT/TIG domain-containing protein [Acidobacteriaceae bacterium]
MRWRQGLRQDNFSHCGRSFARAGAMVLFCLLAALVPAYAGGPRWVTGTSYFNHAGILIGWGNGQVAYYTDQGDLSASVNNAAANALVAAAAAPWNAVATAAVHIQAAGTLDEDVNGSNVSMGANGVLFPADVQSTYTAKPLAILYDEDGSITDALLGQGASDPTSCLQNGVTESVDNISKDGVIVHAVLILNGRCTGTQQQLLQMQYQLERMFGRVLGLAWSQLNDNVFTQNPPPVLAQEEAWPLMHPIDILCGPYTYQCMVNPFQLRMDDRAALGKLYPVTTSNQAQFPGKQVTAQVTSGLVGTVKFPDGQPMEGVNVVMHHYQPFTSPIFVFPDELESSVSGYAFHGNAGNPVTGYTDAMGNRADMFGTAGASQEGYYDLRGVEIQNAINYAAEFFYVTFEPINPLYVGAYAVGPYSLNPVTPSGTIAPVVTWAFLAGRTSAANVTATGAATDAHSGSDGKEASPASVPADGWWNGRITGYGHTAWYELYVQANRSFTVETTALDEQGHATSSKAMPVIGIWNATDALGSPPALHQAAFNGAGIGKTTLAAQTSVAEELRIAIADQRGDGRPDFAYQARVFYADHISPSVVDPQGGQLTISGIGFRAGNTVTVAGVAATVLNENATQIQVQVPALASLPGVTQGSAVDVTVTDNATGGTTTMQSALTYGAPTSVAGSTAQLIVVSGDRQFAAATNTFAPVILEVTDGAGHAVPNALVQIYQTVTGWQEPCPAHGRCPQPALLGQANTAMTTDANGQLSIDPLQIANRAETTKIIATAGTNGLVQVVLVKHP